RLQQRSSCREQKICQSALLHHWQDRYRKGHWERSPERVFSSARGKKAAHSLHLHGTQRAIWVGNGRHPGFHLITGEFKPYEKGPVIEMSNCEYVGGASPPVSTLAAALSPLARRESPHSVLNGQWLAAREETCSSLATGHWPLATLYLPSEKG